MLSKDIYRVKYRAKADISLFAVIKNNGKVRVFTRFYIITKVNFIAFVQHPHSAVPAYGDGFTLDLFDNADPYGVKIWHFFIPVKSVYCNIGKSLKIYIVLWLFGMRFLTLVNLLHHLDMYVFLYLDEKCLPSVIFAFIDLIDRVATWLYCELVIISSDNTMLCI